MVYGTYNYSIHGVYYKPTNIMFGGLTLYMFMDFHGFSTSFSMEKMGLAPAPLINPDPRSTVPHEDGEPTQLVFRCLQHVLSKAQLESRRKSVGKVWEIPWQTSNP
jgi:hypothetical protein